MTNQTSYVIVATRHFFGAQDTRSLVRSALDSGAAVFATSAAAREHVREHLDSNYRLGHNESCAPDYSVRRMNSLPQYLTWQLG